MPSSCFLGSGLADGDAEHLADPGAALGRMGGSVGWVGQRHCWGAFLGDPERQPGWGIWRNGAGLRTGGTGRTFRTGDFSEGLAYPNSSTFLFILQLLKKNKKYQYNSIKKLTNFLLSFFIFSHIIQKLYFHQFTFF